MEKRTCQSSGKDWSKFCLPLLVITPIQENARPQCAMQSLWIGCTKLELWGNSSCFELLSCPGQMLQLQRRWFYDLYDILMTLVQWTPCLPHTKGHRNALAIKFTVTESSMRKETWFSHRQRDLVTLINQHRTLLKLFADNFTKMSNKAFWSNRLVFIPRREFPFDHSFDQTAVQPFLSSHLNTKPHTGPKSHWSQESSYERLCQAIVCNVTSTGFLAQSPAVLLDRQETTRAQKEYEWRTAAHP